MYIGTVKLSNEWTKVEDLIKDQVDGQSAFAFDDTKNYQLQGEGISFVRLLESAAAPAENNNDGFRIIGTQSAYYTPVSGSSLYARVELFDINGYPNIGDIYLKVSTVGE